MNRWAVILGCVLGLLGAGCAGDDSDGSGGTAGSGAGAGASSGGAGAGSGGAGGSNAGSGGGSSSTGGSAGTAGTGSTGTGGNSGTGGSGTGGGSGASGSGTGGSSGASGAACGGRGLPACEGGSFCDFPPEADCGRFDAPGTCRALTDMACPELYAPVCGCDGTTYSSSCHAHQFGISIDHDGECGEELPMGGHNCVPPSGVACLIAPPSCVEGQVPSYDDDACGGDCVPIEQCDCAGPEDCPFEGMYTCHLSAAHCGPFVN